ncbi:MAG: queuosine precursor transporter [Archaeoglobaceae archaeon]|nr:queuosine precursor transporter [Archaeoglobaceae archaeon]MDW7989893.1 queuosine precursor transporter [Archaeoglobaceae archaeon]
MLNEILGFILLIVCFSGITLFFRIFGKAGLYAWMAMAIIIANIQVTKIIEVFGLVTAMGNVIYGSTFLVTDILTERYGVRCARKAVLIGFFAMVFATFIIQITILFKPHENDVVSEAMAKVFQFMPSAMVASLTAYLVSQIHDVWAFEMWKKKTKGKFLWIRNNASTMVSQLIDNFTFTVLFFIIFNPEFLTILGWSGIFEIFITSYAMKLVVALLDTPFIYLSTVFKLPD